MSEPVVRMKSLMNSLPERDTPLGHKFLNERDFESLKELIDSAIYKVEKSLGSENPKEEYLKTDIEKLIQLKSEVDIYILQIGMPEDDYNEDEELEEDYEVEEDFY